MFLKNVKQIISKKISIKTRLTLFYSFMAFTILTIITLFLYWESMNILHKTDYQFLSDEAESLQAILEMTPINFSALIQKII